MRRILMAIALTCVLSATALAGEMPTCGAPAPAPGETQSSVVAKVLLAIIGLLPR